MQPEEYIKSKCANLGSLFREEYSEFIIPDYQRTYDWKKSLVDDLLKDILDAFDKKKDAYFIGAIILSEKENTNQSFDVVDGQQRIITISLLIAHLASKMKDFSKESSLAKKDKEGLRDWSVRLKDLIIIEKNEYPRVKFPSHEHQKFYKKLLLDEDPAPEDHTTTNLNNNYKTIKAFVEKAFPNKENTPTEKLADKLQKFREFLLEQVILTILISKEEKLDAYEIFEVLNDRRQELTQVDLLKNYFFRMVKNSPKHSENTKYNWKALADIFKNNLTDMEGCMGSYFMWRFGDIKTKHLYREVKKRNEKNNYHTPKKKIEEEIEEYVYQLKNHVGRFYRKIKKNSEDLNERPDKKKNQNNQEFRQYIDFLRNFRILYPCLLAPLLKEKYQPDKSWQWETVTKYYKLLYYFILRIYSSRRSFPANKLQPFFAKLAYNINTNKDGLENFKEVQKYLKKESETYNDSFDKESFINNFSLLKVNDSKKAKQILVAINYLYSKPDTKIDLNNVDLEHILPKNWDEKSEDWKDFLPEDANNYLNMLGNYTLWYKKNNRGTKDAPYKSKKDQYKESQVKITREIKNHNWSPKAIRDRQKKWAKKAEESWQLDKL